jgi:hypothetical protein
VHNPQINQSADVFLQSQNAVADNLLNKYFLVLRRALSNPLV